MREVTLIGDLGPDVFPGYDLLTDWFQPNNGAPPQQQPPSREMPPPLPPERPPPEPEPPPPTIPGWPPPAVPLARAWVQDPGAPGGWVYVLQSGDTLSGLAYTYLGAYTRWREIWKANAHLQAQGRSPDKLFVGEKLYMPAEAIDNARKRKLVPMTTAKKAGVVVAVAAAGVVVAGGIGLAVAKWG